MFINAADKDLNRLKIIKEGKYAKSLYGFGCFSKCQTGRD